MGVAIRERIVKDKSKSKARNSKDTSATQRKKNNYIRLYLDLYHNRKRWSEFLDLYFYEKDAKQRKESYRVAEEIKKIREQELISRDYGIESPSKTKADFVAYFETIAKTKPARYSAWHNCRKHLRDFTSGYLQFKNISETWLESYQAYLLGKVAANTAHTYFAHIKIVLRKAFKEGYLRRDFSSLVPNVKKLDTSREFLTTEELQRLLDTPCQHSEIKRAFLFACRTGLRLGDIEALTPSHIQNNQVKVRQQKTDGFVTVHLDSTARFLLYGTDNISLMPHTKIFDLPSRPYILRTLRKWATDAKIDKKISFHVSRHTFATALLSEGSDLYTVSKLLGHRNMRTTEIYAKVVDAKKKEAIERLPALKFGAS
ncbi:MAG: site-specific integrase [Acidobacteria bacterium]|nr:site-specific integrase [Acidobacteriota bacterium]